MASYTDKVRLNFSKGRVNEYCHSCLKDELLCLIQYTKPWERYWWVRFDGSGDFEAIHCYGCRKTTLEQTGKIDAASRT